MIKQINAAAYHEAAREIQKRIQIQPEIGLVLGSGLGPLADEVENPVVIETASIPGWPRSTVQGHSGRLVVGTWAGRSVLVQQGRVHFYEGYEPSDLIFAVRVMRLLGVRSLVVTNAAGGINPKFKAGDVMMITDQISFAAMSGFHPLRGRNLDEFGTRFPDMSQAYDREYQALVRQAAEKLGVRIQEGVYTWLSGPSFETPAEVRFLGATGTDAVGMSTVPEVIAANHCGMRVLGFSGITNACTHDGEAKTTHQEVLEAAGIIGPKIIRILKEVLPSL